MTFDHRSYLIRQHLYPLQIFSTCAPVIITRCLLQCPSLMFSINFPILIHTDKEFKKRFQTICIYPCRHSRSPLQGRPWSWETDRRAAVSGVPWIAVENEDRGKTARSGRKIPSVLFDSRPFRQVPSPVFPLDCLCECVALSAALQIWLRHWLTGEAGLQSCSS